MFKAPFSFAGRIRRKEYAITFFAYWAITLPLITLSIEKEQFVVAISSFIILFLTYFFLAQGSKRCHDLGKTGWWQFVPFYIFWLLFNEGKFGKNHYGANPKGL